MRQVRTDVAQNLKKSNRPTPSDRRMGANTEVWSGAPVQTNIVWFLLDSMLITLISPADYLVISTCYQPTSVCLVNLLKPSPIT
jgi:hypothetical protein